MSYAVDGWKGYVMMGVSLKNKNSRKFLSFSI